MFRRFVSCFLLLSTSAPLLATQAFGAGDPGFAAQANELCRAIIAARDPVVMEGAKTGMFDLLADAMRGNPAPDAERAAEFAAVLAGSRDELVSSVEALRAIAPSDAETTRHLAVVFAHAQHAIDIRTARLALLDNAGTQDWHWPMETALGVAHGPNNDTLMAAWDALGFGYRECQFVFYADGFAPDVAPYWAQASALCSVVADRRLASDYETWREDALMGLVALHNGDALPDGLGASVQAMAEEWAQTAQDLAEVTASDTPFAEDWAELMAMVEANRAVYAARAEALADGDAAAIRASFVDMRPAGLDPRAAGLEQSACNALGRMS